MTGAPRFWATAATGALSKPRQSPVTSTRALILLMLDPHQLHAPADRLNKVYQGCVRVLGQEDAAGPQDDAGPARLGDGVLGLGLGVRTRAVLERAPLVEAALHRPGNDVLALGERRPGATVVPVPHVRGQGGETVEHQPLAVTVEHGETRALAHRLEDAPVMRLAEARVLVFRVEGVARRLHGIEDALGALAEAGLHEGENGLGDGGEGVLDEVGVLLEIVVEPVARELARQGERAEHRRHHRAVGPAIHHAADDGLDVRGPACGLHGHRSDLLPIIGRVDGVACARAMAVGRGFLALYTAPAVPRITAGRRDLEEVRAVAFVEAQRGLGQGGRRTVHRREVTPECIGRSVRRLAPDGGEHALSLGHGLGPLGLRLIVLLASQSPISMKPLLTAGRPFSVRTSKAIPRLALPLVSPRARTVIVEGRRTMSVKRHAMRRTRRAASAGSRRSTRETARARVAVPCRMISGNPASMATARSVWMGFQMRAHSV